MQRQLEEERADAIACTQFRGAGHSRFVVDPHDTATRAEVQLRHNGAAGLDGSMTLNRFRVEARQQWRLDNKNTIKNMGGKNGDA